MRRVFSSAPTIDVFGPGINATESMIVWISVMNRAVQHSTVQPTSLNVEMELVYLEVSVVMAVLIVLTLVMKYNVRGPHVEVGNSGATMDRVFQILGDGKEV